MNSEFLDEYLKSPEEHLQKFIQENCELREKNIQLENENAKLKSALLFISEKLYRNSVEGNCLVSELKEIIHKTIDSV